MITRRTFLKRLSQTTILAMASPTALAELVKATAPVEDVLGPVLNHIKNSQFNQKAFPDLYLTLPAREYDRLEAKIAAQARFTHKTLADRGYDNLIIKGIPIVRKNE